MLRCRTLLNGLARPPNRSLNDQEEKYSLLREEENSLCKDRESATSQKVGEKQNGAHLNAQMKRSASGGKRIVRNICNKIPLIGPLLPRTTGNERITISSLNDGILTQIFRHLLLVDQVCLSLSCKRLFARYKVFAKDSPLLLPRPTDLQLPLSYVNSNDKLRTELLSRLENSRWVYCAECLLLRPRKMFTQDALSTSVLERRCTHYDGVMEICPCFCLTRRDRRRIIDLLKSPTTTAGFRYGCYVFAGDGQPPAEHFCPFYSKAGHEVRVYTEFSICGMGFLNLNIWYSMRSSFGDPCLTANPVFACPHLDLRSLIDTTGDFTKCKKCRASIWRQHKSLEDADLVIFNVHRSLGLANWPVRFFWYDRCRDPEDKAANRE